MKKISLGLLVVAAVFALESQAKQIRIETRRTDCIAGLPTMDVAVQVEREKFSFRPSCNDWFSQEFKLKDGTHCRISAGMCTRLTPEHKIEIECEDSFTEFVDVDC